MENLKISENILEKEEVNKNCLYKKWNDKSKCFIHCKLPICKNKNNLDYCGNHLPLGEEGPNGIMVQCQICKQIIGDKIMNKHLKKCKKSEEIKYKEISNENIINPRLWIKKENKLNDNDEVLINSIAEKINFMFDKINKKV